MEYLSVLTLQTAETSSLYLYERTRLKRSREDFDSFF